MLRLLKYELWYFSAQFTIDLEPTGILCDSRY